jgi:hypothetical protein
MASRQLATAIKIPDRVKLSSTQFQKPGQPPGAETGASAYMGAFLVSEDGVHGGHAWSR